MANISFILCQVVHSCCSKKLREARGCQTFAVFRFLPNFPTVFTEILRGFWFLGPLWQPSIYIHVLKAESSPTFERPVILAVILVETDFSFECMTVGPEMLCNNPVKIFYRVAYYSEELQRTTFWAVWAQRVNYSRCTSVVRMSGSPGYWKHLFMWYQLKE